MNDFGIKITHTPNGYSYYVSDEQLAAFAKLTMLERLQWVEDARMFTLMAQTPETKARHEALRKGILRNNDEKTSPHTHKTLL